MSVIAKLQDSTSPALGMYCAMFLLVKQDQGITASQLKPLVVISTAHL